MDQEVFQKYRKTYGVRFSSRQKRAARQALTEDFEDLGYQAHSLHKRRYLRYVDNLIFGNIHHARTVIIVPYDTPQRVFWWKNRYFPFNGTHTLNKGILSLLAPVVVVYVGLFALLHFGEQYFHEPAQIRILSILMLVILGLLVYGMMHGIANRHNDNRNTAGITAAIEIAKTLNKDQRRNTAFLFLDGNYGRFYGAQLAAETFQNEHKNPNVILLNTFAKGSVIQIGYGSKGKKIALDLHQMSESIKTMEIVAMNDAMRLSTPMEYFPKAIAISAGEIDAKGELCVLGTATPKDRQIDTENVDAVVALLQTYIKKQK